jgi:hydroxymethylglutaryl-CoA lyase
LTRVRIVEVGPRDGLQNQAGQVPTEVKIRFVDALSESGLDEIEVSSFVSPKWIPQLADAEQVFAGIRRAPGVVYMALVPNVRGLERAQRAAADKVAVFTAASETFSLKNTNATIAESLARFAPVVAQAGVPVRGYISTAFHCPYEGPIGPEKVLDVARALLDLGCAELSIGDTIGTATPAEVRRLLELLIPWPGGPAGSRCISTTLSAGRSKTSWPPRRWASGFSIRAPAVSAGVPTLRGRPATFRPRPWSRHFRAGPVSIPPDSSRPAPS